MGVQRYQKISPSIHETHFEEDIDLPTTVLHHPGIYISCTIFKSELINVNLGRFDFSRKYKMFDNVIIGTKFVNLSIEYDVTLATQSSLDKLHWISHIAR